MKILLIALPLASILAGCSSEPSSSDIRDAIKNAVRDKTTLIYGRATEEQIAARFKEIEPQVDSELKDIEKVKCEKSIGYDYLEKHKYDYYGCEIKKSSKPDGARHGSITVRKTSDGWEVKSLLTYEQGLRGIGN